MSNAYVLNYDNKVISCVVVGFKKRVLAKAIAIHYPEPVNNVVDAFDQIEGERIAEERARRCLRKFSTSFRPEIANYVMNKPAREIAINSGVYPRGVLPLKFINCQKFTDFDMNYILSDWEYRTIFKKEKQDKPIP